MNMDARLALMDMLQAINTLKHLGEEIKKSSLQGSTLSLDGEEQLLLKGAFTLMQRTLGVLAPLVWNGTQYPDIPASKATKKPVLYLV